VVMLLTTQCCSSSFLRFREDEGGAKHTPGLDSRDDPMVLSLAQLLRVAASSTPTGLWGSDEHRKTFLLDGRHQYGSSRSSCASW